MDLFPTVCGLCGIPVPDGLDGIDLGAFLADPQSASPPRSFAPTAYYTYGVRVKGGHGANEDEPHSAMRAVRERDWKYVEVEGGSPLLFDVVHDPAEIVNLAGDPEYAGRCTAMRSQLFKGFSWDHVHRQLAADRERLKDFLSGHKPTTPNQYMLPDGRVFDAEKSLYDARWVYLTPVAGGGGIIPQQFG